MIKGVIFDLDGTLVMAEQLHHLAFERVFKEFGIDFTLEEWVTKYAGAGSEHAFRAIFADRGVLVTEEQIVQCVAKKHAFYSEIVQQTNVPVVRGAVEFVQNIQKQGLKKIIATGNSNMQAVRLMLERVGLFVYFPEILSISKVPHGKPAPDVFLAAADRLGLTPEECIVFEDSINGVKAAKAAGIRCIALSTTTRPEALMQAGADEVVRDYTWVREELFL